MNEIIQPILEGMTGQEAADVIQSNLELLDGTKAPISTVEDIKGLQAEQVELSNKIEEVKETIPTVEVGTVTPVKGIHPNINNVGTDRQIVLDFVLPDTNTVNAGVTTTLPYTQQAKVTNVGTAYDAVFNFEIPSGLPGSKGEKGDGKEVRRYQKSVMILV